MSIKIDFEQLRIGTVVGALFKKEGILFYNAVISAADSIRAAISGNRVAVPQVLSLPLQVEFIPAVSSFSVLVVFSGKYKVRVDGGGKDSKDQQRPEEIGVYSGGRESGIPRQNASQQLVIQLPTKLNGVNVLFENVLAIDNIEILEETLPTAHLRRFSVKALDLIDLTKGDVSSTGGGS